MPRWSILFFFSEISRRDCLAWWQEINKNLLPSDVELDKVLEPTATVEWQLVAIVSSLLERSAWRSSWACRQLSALIISLDSLITGPKSTRYAQRKPNRYESVLLFISPFVPHRKHIERKDPPVHRCEFITIWNYPAFVCNVFAAELQGKQGYVSESRLILCWLASGMCATLVSWVDS